MTRNKLRKRLALYLIFSAPTPRFFPRLRAAVSVKVADFATITAPPRVGVPDEAIQRRAIFRPPARLRVCDLHELP